MSSNASVLSKQGTVIERVNEDDQDGPDVPDGGTTYATTLSFIGEAEPKLSLKLYDGNDLVYEGHVDPKRHWSAVAKNLKAGLHHFIAKTDDGKFARWSVTVKDLVNQPQ